MMRVVAAPAIQFKCEACGAVNEGDPSDFRERHTMPPSYVARCAFCKLDSVCFPSALIARAAARALGNA